MTMTIATVGHSNRTLAELLAVLRAHAVERLVDVRRHPRSRRHPHFDRDALGPALEAAGIAYAWEADLGAFRKGRADSPHTALRDEGSAAYADHMATGEFAAAIRRVLDGATDAGTAILCAEAKPEGCHRRLICDWLLARDVGVVHLVSADETRPHVMTPFARLEHGRLVYDGGQGTLF